MSLPLNRQAAFDTLCDFIQAQDGVLDRPALLERYTRGLEWRGIPEVPKTHIDPVMFCMIESKHGKEARQILETKKWITAVEGCIGHLLERYIDSRISDGQWIWCAGSVVKSTDFLKKSENGWLQLQIKNRNNTENSSSSAIRTGTEIRLWFRFFSQTGKTNWNSLPNMLGMDYGMNEHDFQKYVCSILGQKTPANLSCLDEVFV